MSARTGIEWCDSTFNPWWGCVKVSPACDHCYAERDAKRFAEGRVLWGVGAERRTFGEKHWKAPGEWAKTMPAKLGRRPRVFCASMGDWLDLDAPVDQFVRLLDVIRLTPELDWLLLSKRIGNWRRRVAEAHSWCASASDSAAFQAWVEGWLRGEPPTNVWLGATVVTQAEADRDVMKLLAVPARVRFLSVEPMLGPLDLQRACTYACPNGDCFDSGGRRWVVDSVNGGTHAECACSRLNGLSWVIVGGESGPKARPMHPDWARSLRDQCAAAEVPFLFKQWGEWCPRGPESLGYPSVDGVPRIRLTDAGHDGQDLASDGGNDVWMNRAGKKAAGRLLDGRTHDGFPGVAHA